MTPIALRNCDTVQWCTCSCFIAIGIFNWIRIIYIYKYYKYCTIIWIMIFFLDDKLKHLDSPTTTCLGGEKQTSATFFRTQVIGFETINKKVEKKHVHPWRLTWNLKINSWKRRFLLETIIFRFHVNLWGCNLKLGCLFWRLLCTMVNHHLGE